MSITVGTITLVLSPNVAELTGPLSENIVLADAAAPWSAATLKSSEPTVPWSFVFIQVAAIVAISPESLGSKDPDCCTQRIEPSVSPCINLTGTSLVPLAKFNIISLPVDAPAVSKANDSKFPSLFISIPLSDDFCLNLTLSDLNSISSSGLVVPNPIRDSSPEEVKYIPE